MPTETWIYVLTLLVLTGQLWVFDKQLRLMQADRDWRRDEAVARFYQLGLRLASNFARTDSAGGDINVGHPLDLTFDPELVAELANAATRFAPLGRTAVRHLVTASFSLTVYLGELQHLSTEGKGDEPNVIATLQVHRRVIGERLDRAVAEIPPALQWRRRDEQPFDFKELCSDGGTARAVLPAS